jgi:hypothetical protein
MALRFGQWRRADRRVIQRGGAAGAYPGIRDAVPFLERNQRVAAERRPPRIVTAMTRQMPHTLLRFLLPATFAIAATAGFASAAHADVVEVVKEQPRVETIRMRPELVDVFRQRPDFLQLVRERPELVELLRERPEVIGVIRQRPELIDLIRERPEVVGVFRQRPETIQVLGQRPETIHVLRQRPEIVRTVCEHPELIARVRL